MSNHGHMTFPYKKTSRLRKTTHPHPHGFVHRTEVRRYKNPIPGKWVDTERTTKTATREQKNSSVEKETPGKG